MTVEGIPNKGRSELAEKCHLKFEGPVILFMRLTFKSFFLTFWLSNMLSARYILVIYIINLHEPFVHFQVSREGRNPPLICEFLTFDIDTQVALERT